MIEALIRGDHAGRALAWTAHPLEVAARWPLDRPLLMVHSARTGGAWARWSILATPRAWYGFADGLSRLDGPGSGRPARSADPLFVHDPQADLDALLGRTAMTSGAPLELPFAGGWIGYLSYELGRRLEPAMAGHGRAARGERERDDPWPDVELAWCPDALVHDGLTGRWHAAGDAEELAAAIEARPDAPPPRAEAMIDPAWTASVSRARYEADVRRVLEYIRAGDAYQVNLSRRLSTPWNGSTRDLARRALPLSGAWYGAYLELPGGRAILSLSPELFLDVEPGSRLVTTRPIKGTRPGHRPPRELLASDKDAAELHMIVDLMRNDLGRVCRFGSVRVVEGRTIETHPTVHHGVGQVEGRLRADVTPGALLAATFPPGSVTGAPKIRAARIIDELERVPRGPYCGAVGWFGDDGRIALNVAIRTLMLRGRREPGRFDRVEGRLDYGTGGGVVADSDPAAEFEETEDKARVLRLVLGEEGTSERRNVGTSERRNRRGRE